MEISSDTSNFPFVNEHTLPTFFHEHFILSLEKQKSLLVPREDIRHSEGIDQGSKATKLFLKTLITEFQAFFYPSGKHIEHSGSDKK